MTVETIALSGEAAPGASDDFSTFGVALVNDLGQIAFHSRLASTLDETVWLWDEVGGLELQSRTSFLDIDPDSLRLSSAGVGHGQNETVVEIVAPDAAGNPQVVAADGAAAPGGGTFDLSSSEDEDLAVSNAGVTFETHIDDGSRLAAIFRQDAGFALQEVFRQGDVAPGAGGEDFDDFIDGVINDSRELVFEAYLDLVGTRALFGPAAGGETLLLKTGDEPPGVPGGQFRGFGGGPQVLSVNNAGRVAFRGNLIIGPGGVTANDETAIWGPHASGGFQLVARNGSTAPDAGAATFIGFDRVALNSQNSISFLGILTGAGVDAGNDYGLWAGRMDLPLHVVAREGDAAIGLPGEFLATPFDLNFGLNGHDQLAFAAELAGGGAAIWLHDLATDSVELILGPGQIVEVGPGDERVVARAWFGDALDLEIHSGGEDGKKTILNDARQIAALLEFTDSSQGVFRLTYDSGACTAADGEALSLSNDTVSDTVVYEVCDIITVGPNYLVAGPDGDLTLRAGGSVVLMNGTTIGAGGRLTVDNDPTL
jgi:hypothetical protein